MFQSRYRIEAGTEYPETVYACILPETNRIGICYVTEYYGPAAKIYRVFHEYAGAAG